MSQQSTELDVSSNRRLINLHEEGESGDIRFLNKSLSRTHYEERHLKKLLQRIAKHRGLAFNYHKQNDQNHARKHFDILCLYFLILFNNNLILQLTKNEKEIIFDIYDEIDAAFSKGKKDDLTSKIYKTFQTKRSYHPYNISEKESAALISLCCEPEKSTHQFLLHYEENITKLSNDFASQEWIFKACKNNLLSEEYSQILTEFSDIKNDLIKDVSPLPNNVLT